MKRKMLEALPLVKLSKKNRELIKQDIPKTNSTHRTYGKNKTFLEYERDIYLEAKIMNEVLLVALYPREYALLNEEPYCTIFIDKNDFETRMADGSWKTAKIDMIDIPYTKGMKYAGAKWYSDSKTDKLVGQFLNTDKKAKAAVLEYQINHRTEQLNKKHRRETDEVDEIMELIPDVPNDFSKWVEMSGMTGHQYIFYHANAKKKEQEALCSQCGYSFMVPGARRDKEYTCPSCKIKAVLKPWKSQDEHIRVHVALMQKMTNKSGWVVRRFNASKIVSKKNGWKANIYLHEETRETFDNELHHLKHYEYGQYKLTGINRWSYSCHDPFRKSYYYNPYEIGDVRLFPNNIAKERKGTVIKYIPIEKALRNTQGLYVHPVRMMETLRQRPEIEYFIKMGFKKLTVQILNGEVHLHEGKKPWELLQISKELMNQALKYNAGIREIDTLKAAAEKGYVLTKEQMKFFTRFTHGELFEKVLRLSTPHKYFRYFTEQLRKEKLVGDYFDYIENAEVLNWDLKNEMILFPKHFVEAHDQSVDERRTLENKMNAMKVREQNKEFKKIAMKMKELFSFENEEFFIKIPEKKADFIQEGQNNHNCVSGYFEKVLKGQTYVVFIRKKAEPEKSYCTVEISKMITLKQLRAKCNSDAPPEVKQFADKWMKEVMKRQRKLEASQETNQTMLMSAV